MVDYDDIPLFPLHVVLFPDMPLPLHIFEPRYREMILRCREEKSQFGIVLIQSGADIGAEAVTRQVGTLARITQFEELPDGRMNILVSGESRFRITRISHDKPYLSASVELIQEESTVTFQTESVFEAVASLFRTYLQSLFAMTGRTLGTLQLPQEPEFLSYAVASVLQVPFHEKQALLEMTDTERRLAREMEILSQEIEAQDTLQAVVGGLSLPVDTQALGKNGFAELTPLPTKRYFIIGAGAAGLSLCHALLEHGVTDDIVIFDQKSEFRDDRTWCFWDTIPHPYHSLVSRCWHRWDVTDTKGRCVSSSSGTVGYACLRGIDFYNHVLGIIRYAPNVTLNLGCPAESCVSLENVVSVSAGGQTWNADFVFDSRPRAVPNDELTFSQRFFGQYVQSNTPAFDPARCMLMDFRVSQSRGLHFFYLLPFSATEALVENTFIERAGTGPMTAEQHRAEISAYLSAAYPQQSFAVEREEAGAIPMTPQPFSKRDGRIFSIGTAGGCTKPSSGYTFTRIQDQCRQIAAAAAANTLESFHEKPASARYRFFDTVFLQALSDHPDAFPDYFYRLFTRVSPEALTAFLSETSSWSSDIQILRSLPLAPFLRAAIHSAPLWAGRQP